MKINISFNMKKTEIEISDEKTMEETASVFFNKIGEEFKIDELRIVYKGKIMDKASTLAANKIEEDSCVYFFKQKDKKVERKAAPKAQQQNVQMPHGGYQQPPQMGYPPQPNMGYPPQQNMGYPPQMPPAGNFYQQMNNSSIQNLMGQQLEMMMENPEQLDNLINQTNLNVPPEQREILKKQLKDQFELFKQNPQAFKDAMAQMSQYQGMAPPMNPYYQPNPYQQYSPYQQAPPFNPYYQQQPMQQQQQHFTEPDFKVLYKNQLEQLKEMGFPNEELNLQALKNAQGDINAALEFLDRWTK